MAISLGVESTAPVAKKRDFNMTSSEKLCLKWNDFQETVLSSFKDLRHDKDFTDVTLACEDGKQLAVHKVVLSSVSPLFMSLLKSNKHQHPLLYMRGMKSEDLVAIIDFLYLGEANVHQDNLDSFLSVANELKLKGLTEELENPTYNENENNLKDEPLFISFISNNCKEQNCQKLICILKVTE